MRERIYLALAGLATLAAIGWFVWAMETRDSNFKRVFAKACPHQYAFEPQPDITTQELAVIASKLALGSGRMICEDDAHLIPAEYKRHFREITASNYLN